MNMRQPSQRRRKNQQRQTLQVGLGIAGALLVVIAAGVAIFAFTRQPPWAPHTDHYTFTRDVAVSADSLNPANVRSEEDPSVTLASVFSADKLDRYGGAVGGPPPHGYGLEVTFHTTVNGREMGQPARFAFAGWNRFEETANMVRQRDAEAAQQRFDTMKAAFVKAVDVQPVTVFVLDTTDPISDQLSSTVRTALRDWCSGKAALFHISGSEYQAYTGLTPCDGLGDAARNGFVSAKPSPHSSVYGGILNLLRVVKGIAAQTPNAVVTVHIFTDGVENTDVLDFYHHPELLTDPANRVKLDAVFDISGLDFAGVKVVLHGLPQTASVDIHRQDLALAYIAARLQAAGAKVEVAKT